LVFAPHADAFLRLLEKAVLDRSDTVASSYAVAAGYVSRAASDAQVLSLLAFARRLYFDSEGDRDAAVPRRAISAGEIVRAVSRHANDKFNALAADVLPFVFVAKHDAHDVVRELFRDTWDDNVAGPRAVSLYLKEIAGLAVQYLDAAVWAVKHTSAKAVADAAVLIASLGVMDDKAAEVLWSALDKALTGKTWEGKEEVLNAFVKFVEASRSFWSGRGDVAQAIEKVRGLLSYLLTNDMCVSLVVWWDSGVLWIRC